MIRDHSNSYMEYLKQSYTEMVKVRSKIEKLAVVLKCQPHEVEKRVAKLVPGEVCEMQDIIIKRIGEMGRMLSMVKVAPKGEIVVWNANLLVDGKKVWYGDINLTTQNEALQALADELSEVIHILREHDCRFSTELKPNLKNAVAMFVPARTI
jgi:hypothetical protein